MPTQNIAKYSGTTTPPMDNSSVAAGIRYDTVDGFMKYDDGGSARIIINAEETQTISGNKTFTGTTVMSGDGSVQMSEVSITSAQVKAIRATPITLVAAPAAGKVLRFLGASLYLDYAGTNGFTESTNNLAIRYTDGSGIVVSGTIEMTGFIDQVADTASQSIPVIDAIVAKTGCDAKALVLHNTSGAEIAGNAAADNVLRVKTWYSVTSPGWS